MHSHGRIIAHRAGWIVLAQKSSGVAYSCRLSLLQFLIHRIAVLMIRMAEQFRQTRAIVLTRHSGVIVVKVKKVPQLKCFVRVGYPNALFASQNERCMNMVGPIVKTTDGRK